MTSELKIPQLFPFKKELKELLNQLLDCFDLQVIYLSEIEIKENKFYIINGILERKRTFSKEQLTLLHKVENSNLHFKLQLYTKKQLRASLHNGELYFIKHCYYGQVVYQNTGSNSILSKFKDTFLLNQSKKQLGHNRNSISKVFHAIQHRFAASEYNAATGMLLNILHTLFQHLGKLYSGQNIKFTTLKEYIQHLSSYDSEIHKFFMEGRKEVSEMLELMEILNSKPEKPPTTKIYRSDFYEMFVVIQILFKKYNELSSQMFTSCEEFKQEYTKPTFEVKEPKLHQPFDIAIQKVVDFLREHYQIHAILLINKQQESYNNTKLFGTKTDPEHFSFSATVFLIVHQAIPINPSQLTDLVYNHMNKQMKIYFTWSILSKVREQADYGNNFLYRVLQTNNIIFKEDDRLIKDFDREPYYYIQMWEKLQKRWQDRFDRALYLQELTHALDNEHDYIANMALFENALVQACIGLLAVFWEYKPSYTSLDYLMHLCSDFTDLPMDIFWNSSYKSARNYNLITQSKNHLRHDCPYKISEKDNDQVYKLCDRFITAAEKEVNKHLDYLKVQCFERETPLFYKSS